LQAETRKEIQSSNRERKKHGNNNVLPIPHLQVRRFSHSLKLPEPDPTLDPIFAVSVGVAAAVVRINREEKEKGKSFEESKASLGRRAALAWKEVMGEEEKRVVKGSG
jgi:hypothetical protein